MDSWPNKPRSVRRGAGISRRAEVPSPSNAQIPFLSQVLEHFHARRRVQVPEPDGLTDGQAKTWHFVVFRPDPISQRRWGGGEVGWRLGWKGKLRRQAPWQVQGSRHLGEKSARRLAPSSTRNSHVRSVGTWLAESLTMNAFVTPRAAEPLPTQPVPPEPVPPPFPPVPDKPPPLPPTEPPPEPRREPPDPKAPPPVDDPPPGEGPVVPAIAGVRVL